MISTFLSLAAALAAQSVSQPDYLTVRDNHIFTLNRTSLDISAPGQLVQPESRRDTFGTHPYDISLAGFVSSQAAVMVHAEHVADASGASDYSNLPEVTWHGTSFRYRDMCAVVESSDVDSEHDLAWLRRAGLDPVGPLALRQYFTTTSDNNDEVVISIVVKPASCADSTGISNAFAVAERGVEVRSSGQP